MRSTLVLLDRQNRDRCCCTEREEEEDEEDGVWLVMKTTDFLSFLTLCSLSLWSRVLRVVRPSVQAPPTASVPMWLWVGREQRGVSSLV